MNAGTLSSEHFSLIASKMKNRGLCTTDTELANMLNVHRNSIYNYRVGTQALTGIKAKALAAWEKAFDKNDGISRTVIETEIFMIEMDSASRPGMESRGKNGTA